MRIRTMDLQDAYVDYDDYSEVLEPDGDNGDIRQNRNRLTNDDIITLKARADERITDIEKLKLLKSVLSEKRYTSTQVRTIAGWLAFEDSKLNFAKWSYERVTDPQDYWKLEDILLIATQRTSSASLSRSVNKQAKAYCIPCCTYSRPANLLLNLVLLPQAHRLGSERLHTPVHKLLKMPIAKLLSTPILLSFAG